METRFGTKAMPIHIADKIQESGIVAVIIIDKVRHAIPLAEALLKGGVDAIELTLRTTAALDAAAMIKKEVPDITLGFGTVINTEQVKKVVDVGADFAVAPGCNPKIIQEAQKLGLPFAPGIMTPSDIEIAIENGCRIIKFFPAVTSGGISHLDSMVAPYKYLGLQFIPLGGVNMDNAEQYLRSPLITAIGGSWVANRKLIQDENWGQIASNSEEIRALVQKIRN